MNKELHPIIVLDENTLVVNGYGQLETLVDWAKRNGIDDLKDSSYELTSLWLVAFS